MENIFISERKVVSLKGTLYEKCQIEEELQRERLAIERKEKWISRIKVSLVVIPISAAIIAFILSR